MNQLDTPSKVAKAAGMKSLEEVSAMTGVSCQTLINWYKNKPHLFAVVVAGCVHAACLLRAGNRQHCARLLYEDGTRQN
jgi:hypothetical protein